ncbi:hypothetical protein BHE74_00024118 [Ensete ventricosum]|nr:hypothetical protein GW17_00055677 [Ensete ventricosum]RWW68357.1 hypothetical protein BHE74_00024118 [Ensete ventricosum]
MYVHKPKDTDKHEHFIKHLVYILTLYLDIQIRYHCPEEEIALGPSCWLWDYLRRSGASGFLLPLSGGADSSSVAAIVGCMCQLVIKDIEDGDDQVKADSLRIGQYKNGEFPTDSREFVKRIFYTVYMGTENSSEATRSRAKRLADEIGAWHLNVDIDSVVSALLSLFQTLTGKRLRYKYDCSSADINPIGSVSKQDLRSFLRWAAIHLHYPSLAEIEAAPPTAELEPIRSDYNQVFLLTRSCKVLRFGLYRPIWVVRTSPIGYWYVDRPLLGGTIEISRRRELPWFPARSVGETRRDNASSSRAGTRRCLVSPCGEKGERGNLWPYQFRKIDELVNKAADQKAANLTEQRPVDSDIMSGCGSGTGVVAVGSSNPNAGL